MQPDFITDVTANVRSGTAGGDYTRFVCGGMQAVGGPTTRVDIYDPSSDTWTEGPSLPGSGMSGFGSSAFDVDGVLYVSTMDGYLHALKGSSDQWQTVALSAPAKPERIKYVSRGHRTPNTGRRSLRLECRWTNGENSLTIR